MTALLWIVCLLPAADVAAPPSPANMTLEQLETAFGPNRLTVDPTGHTPPAGVPRDTVLRRWYGSAPRTLNGLLWTDANLYDSLIAYCTLDPAIKHPADPSQWAPGVADYASMSGDQTVTVRLLKGIHWQYPAVDRDDPKYAWLEPLFADGAPELTAWDFAFTFDLIHHPENTATYRTYMKGATCAVLDRYTFQVRWRDFNVYAFDLSVSYPQIFPEFLYSRDEEGNVLSKAEVGAYFNDHWHNSMVCGYGPYEFKSFDPNDQIVIERVDDFPTIRPAIERIEWKIIPDSEQVVLNMLDGKLDFTVLMPDQYRKWVEKPGDDSPFRGDDFETMPYEKMEYLYIGWNCRRAPLDDKRVRLALAHAFNRQAFLDNQFNGLGALVDSHVFYKHPHYHGDLAPIRFDLDVASRMLDDAGFGDEDGDGVRDKRVDDEKVVDLSFTIKVFQASNELQSVLAIYREDLLSIGVDIKVEVQPWAELFPQMKSGDFDAYTGLWGLGWALSFYNQFHSDSIDVAGNYVGFQSEESDELIHKYVYGGITDDDERREIALRVQEILHEEQPYLFFMRRNRISAFASWLDGVSFSPARPQLMSFSWHAAKD